MVQYQLECHLESRQQAVDFHILLPGVCACADNTAGANGADSHGQGHVAVRGAGIIDGLRPHNADDGILCQLLQCPLTLRV